MLEKIPARHKVIRHVRPKLSCRTCETIIRAPSPDLPIEKGRLSAGLITNVVVSKYLGGLPPYRQSAILAREGIDNNSGRAIAPRHRRDPKELPIPRFRTRW